VFGNGKAQFRLAYSSWAYENNESVCHIRWVILPSKAKRRISLTY
jgi:hypothetical protein